MSEKVRKTITPEARARGQEVARIGQDVSDIVKVGSSGRAHDEKGRIMALSYDNIKRINEEADYIRTNAPVNSSEDLAVSPSVVPASVDQTATFQLPTFPAPPGWRAEHGINHIPVQGRLRTAEADETAPQWLTQFEEGKELWAKEIARENKPSLRTKEGMMSRFRSRMGELKQRLGSNSGAFVRNPYRFIGTKLGGATQNYIEGNGMDAKFRSKMRSKAELHAAKGNKLRYLGYAGATALGAAAIATLVLKGGRPLGVEVAQAASLIDVPGLGLGTGNDKNNNNIDDSLEGGSNANHEYHFNDENKESKNAFGASLDLDSKQASIDDMEKRYIEDPSLVASHLAAFDSNVNNDDINSLAKLLDKNPKMMDKAVSHLLDLQKGYSVSIENITGNYSSLYMVEGTPPGVYQDNLVGNRGTMLVYIDDQGNKVLIRRECGAQIIQEHEFVGVKKAEEVDIIPEATNHKTRDKFTDVPEEKEKTKKDETKKIDETKKVVTTVTTDVTTTTTPPEETVTIIPPEDGGTPPDDNPPDDNPPEEPPEIDDDKLPEEAPLGHDNGNNLAPDPGPPKPDTNNDGTGTTPGTPAQPQPEIGQPAPQIPNQPNPQPATPATQEPVVPEPTRPPVTSSPSGPGPSNPNIPDNDGSGTTNNGSAGNPGGV